MTAVDTIREGHDVESIATRYAPKKGRGRDVIRAMLSAGAAEPNRTYAQVRIETLPPMSALAVPDAPAARGARTRWGRSTSGYREGAERVARRGAGPCLGPDCPAKVGRRLWCATHTQLHPAERESAERTMRTVLEAAARALSAPF